MNIRPRAGATLRSDNPELPPIQARFATLKVATGMLVPAFDAGGLRTTEGQPTYAHMPPPGEGFRSWPSRAAGPQRQGPYRRLRALLQRPEPPAASTSRADHLSRGSRFPVMIKRQCPECRYSYAAPITSHAASLCPDCAALGTGAETRQQPSSATLRSGRVVLICRSMRRRLSEYRSRQTY
jgi:hypothetical protein